MDQRALATMSGDYVYLPSRQGDHSGADKYHGAVAAEYDAKRDKSPKWIAEQRVVEDMLSDFAEGTVVLDVPCGTGRFLDFYRHKGFYVYAVDLSEDMLALAQQKTFGDQRVRFVQGDVRDLNGLAAHTCDVSVMVRLTRWLSPDECAAALRELQRVTRKRIIFTARVRNHPHARPYELIESALDGWRIARDEAGYEEDYRIIALEPV